MRNLDEENYSTVLMRALVTIRPLASTLKFDPIAPEKFLTLARAFCTACSVGLVFPFVGQDFIDSYIKRRLRRKILVKILLPNTEANHIFSKKSKAELREVRFLENDKFPIPNEIMVCDNKVILLSFSAQIGVIVEDKDIALSLKSIWQLLWNNAKTK